MNFEELDKLAAEKVMGWSYPRYETVGRVIDWQPTRNIVQAWEVLEKSGFYMAIHFDPKETKERFIAVVPRYPSGIQIDAPTAPLAIVRACLRAKGVL